MGKIVKAKDSARALVEAIAMDIGKAVAHHVKTMHPNALSSSGLLSVRNCTYNEIIAALDVTEEGQIVDRLKNRAAHRRKISRLKTARSIHEIRKIMGEP